MALSKDHKEVVKKALNIEKLEIIPCLEEAAIWGLGVGLFSSLFFGFKTGCKIGAVTSGFHVAAKVITSEMFLDMLSRAEVLALMAVIGTATSSSISPYIVAEIIVFIKQVAQKHGLSLVKATTA